MDRATEDRWRAALERKGANVVQAGLDLRPGRPSELMFDVCDEPPYPTRAFCIRWCRGDDGRPSGVASHAAALIAVAGLFVACVLQADSTWPDKVAPRPLYAAEAPLPLGPAPVSDDGIANTSVISTTDANSILPTCSWVSASDSSRTVQRLPPCARLGSTLPAQPGTTRG